MSQITGSVLAVDSSQSKGWQVLDRVLTHEGFAWGCRAPSLSIVVQGRHISAGQRKAVWQTLLDACPGLGEWADKEEDAELVWPQSVQWLLTIWQHLQQAQGMALFESGRIVSRSVGVVRCVVPVGHQGHKAMTHLIQTTMRCLQSHEDVTPNLEEGTHLDDGLSRAVQALKALAEKGSNVPRFVKAAVELGMPMMVMPGGVIQYGIGSKGRRLDSSFTDQTPVIAAKLARNKMWTSALLKQAGLPVAPHLLVPNADQAVKAAHRLVFPVVVKPLDLDGGVGVAAGLLTDQEVRLAFEAAKKKSSNVLVEKHVFGKDYRLTVFQDEAVWTIERVPAAVVGDGQSTVAQLVAQVNSDPRRGNGLHAPLKKLNLDDEATGLLTKLGLSADSVPALGTFVRLRRTANVATGGMPVAVQGQVHPDNARLAVRAAQALGLDLAGIDLLIEDISRSWLEQGSNVAVCEVNGQPNLGQTTSAHLYGQLLKRLVTGNGRVPTILVMGAEHPSKWLDGFVSAFQRHGLRVGTAGPLGVFVDGEQYTTGDKMNLLAAGTTLSMSNRVDAIVVALTEDSVLKTGLPWARYDVLLLAGSHVPSVTDQSEVSKQQHPAYLWMHHLLPACDGWVIASQTAGYRVNDLEKVTKAQWVEASGNQYDVVAKTLELIFQTDQSNSSPYLNGEPSSVRG